VVPTVSYPKDRVFFVVSLIAKFLPDAVSLFWTAKLAGAQVTVDRLELSGAESMRQPRSRLAATERLDTDLGPCPVAPGAVQPCGLSWC